MKLKLNIGSSHPEEQISIEGPEMTEEIQQLVSYVDNLEKLQEIKGSIGDEIYFLDIKDIRSFMSLNKKFMHVLVIQNISSLIVYTNLNLHFLHSSYVFQSLKL